MIRISLVWKNGFNNRLNKLASFLISTSLFLAISGSLKVFFSCLLFNLFILNLILSVFFMIFSIYNLNKLTDIKEDAVNVPDRAKYIKGKEKIFIFFLLFSLTISLFLGVLQDILCVPIILFPIFIGVIYSVRVSSNLPRLKDITGIKNLVVAITWSVGSTFLPAICLPQKSNMLITLVFYFFFLKSFINTVLFDIRDIEGDRLSGVRTIPVVFGREKTKNLLLILNSTLIPWLAISYLSGFFHHYLFVLIFTIAYGYGYILHFCKEGLKIGKSLDLIVDGEWIPVVLLCVMMQRLNLNSHYFFSLISLFKLVGLKEGS